MNIRTLGVRRKSLCCRGLRNKWKAREVLHEAGEENSSLHKAGALEQAHSRGGHSHPGFLVNKELVGTWEGQSWAGWLRTKELHLETEGKVR